MTVAVCLYCGAMKHGAWTSCSDCGHTPEELEDKAKHVIASDHHFSVSELESISVRIREGKPINFKPEDVEGYVASLQTSSFSNFRVGLYVYGCLGGIIALIVGAVILYAKLIGR